MAAPLVDLAAPPDPDTDHHTGPKDADAVILWYGDYQCAHSARAHAVVEHVRSEFPDRVGVVFRHLPLTDIHPHAQMAAEAAEAASKSGQFWAMRAELYRHHVDLSHSRTHQIAASLDLDLEAFATELDAGTHADRVRRDVATADASGAVGTPTIFVNGRRYRGPLEPAPLAQTVTEVLLLADRARGSSSPAVNRQQDMNEQHHERGAET